jgi:hypothetical protein
MCFALPTDSRTSTRESRLPEPLRIVFGGMVFVAIVVGSLLVERLSHGD